MASRENLMVQRFIQVYKNVLDSRRSPLCFDTPAYTMWIPSDNQQHQRKVFGSHVVGLVTECPYKKE
jgi:hypothetical protein